MARHRAKEVAQGTGHWALTAGALVGIFAGTFILAWVTLSLVSIGLWGLSGAALATALR